MKKFYEGASIISVFLFLIAVGAGTALQIRNHKNKSHYRKKVYEKEEKFRQMKDKRNEKERESYLEKYENKDQLIKCYIEQLRIQEEERNKLLKEIREERMKNKILLDAMDIKKNTN